MGCKWRLACGARRSGQRLSARRRRSVVCADACACLRCLRCTSCICLSQKNCVCIVMMVRVEVENLTLRHKEREPTGTVCLTFRERVSCHLLRSQSRLLTPHIESKTSFSLLYRLHHLVLPVACASTETDDHEAGRRALPNATSPRCCTIHHQAAAVGVLNRTPPCFSRHGSTSIRRGCQRRLSQHRRCSQQRRQQP
jgi:hypothetical protein